tara:strand:+ start:1513 stop:2022 length:510 start_codon:yes stop_codon:yes gene_type:complete
MERKKYQKGGKRKTVDNDYLNLKDVSSRRVVKKGKKRTTTKEVGYALANKEYIHPGAGPYSPTTDIPREPYLYNDKELTVRKYKSKVDNTTGEETKRKEKIVYDDGNQMTKRKQRTIKFGKNKGKIKSKTVNYNRGKRTVTKSILDKTNKQKLQTGGFLEAPISRLFED